VTRLFYRHTNREPIAFTGKHRAKSKVRELHGNVNLALIVDQKDARIKILEAELLHYREMVDSMVYQRTELLVRRIDILEHSNSRLGENYHKIHQMYLDLMVKTQLYEAEMHLRLLENEMNPQNETNAI
jgi:hypothetical protein